LEADDGEFKLQLAEAMQDDFAVRRRDFIADRIGLADYLCERRSEGL
jgi:hypothetical protein